MRKGFTLTELILALAVAGVVTALTIPLLINNVSKKTLAAQVKNTIEMIEHVAQDELYTRGVRDLSDTDFADPDKLLSDNHFHIAKKCSAADSLKNCWKTSASGSDKITYTSSDGKSSNLTSAITVLLKNGVMFNYKNEPDDPEIAGYFTIDVNGNTKPNIINKDLLSFYITKRGDVLTYEKPTTTANGYRIGKRNDPTTWEPFNLTRGLTQAECEALPASYGITSCRPGGDDYWAAAVKECGGVQNMPTDDDLLLLAQTIYSDCSRIVNSAPECVGSPDYSNLPTYLSNLGPTTPVYIFWTSTSLADGYRISGRRFDPERSNNIWGDRSWTNGKAICVSD